MATSETPVRTLQVSGHRYRRLAASILSRHPLHQHQITPPRTESPPVRVVCISDTHGGRPEIPPGDVLIHAGDLTDDGSFDEIQDNLDWLAAQPHAHKIYVAGNHDVLLDASFLERHPERRYGSAKTVQDLVWPQGVIYLRDESVTVHVEGPIGGAGGTAPPRRLQVYGSPWTPQYVSSAFQYPRHERAFWKRNIPSTTDIVVTHGPPRLHLDAYAGISRGCASLGEEIARVRPRLHVFGHIHAGYGTAHVVFDATRTGYEAIMNFSAADDAWLGPIRWGWALVIMAASMLWWRLQLARWGAAAVERRVKVTTMVNASVVAWDAEKKRNVLANEPIVVDM